MNAACLVRWTLWVVACVAAGNVAAARTEGRFETGGECWLQQKSAAKGWTIKTLKLTVPDVAELRLYTGPQRSPAVYEREFGFLRKESLLSLDQQ